MNCPQCGEPLINGSYTIGKSNSPVYTSSSNTSYTAQYILSVLIPLVGFIVGAIYLAKEDTHSEGITCIMLGVLSMVLSWIIYAVIL